jgi:hypothetical protein
MSDQDNPSTSLADLGKFYVTPAEDTEAEYFESLGRFIASYATAEAAVHDLTRSLSKLSETKARVIFAGLRLGDLTDRIRAMLRVDNADANTISEINACLDQLDVIAGVRNKLVHRSVSYHDGKLMVSNASTAKTREGVELDQFVRKDLNDMASDCRRIFLRLLNVAHPDLEMMEGLRRFYLIVSQPWSYKPAQPAPRKKSHQKARRLRRHPPDASPA